MSASDALGALAYAALSRQAAALVAHEPGTRHDRHPEDLHDMRVATRRLRAALSLFAAALPEQAPALRAELGWLAAGLGAVRDLDVQIEQLAAWAEDADAADRPGFEALRDVVAAARPAARAALLAQLDSRRYLALVGDLAHMLRAGPPSSEAAEQPLLEAVPRLVSGRYKRLRRVADTLTVASPPHDFHTARIRGKRLRYAAEFVADVYGKPARDFIRVVTRLQDLLGSHQDAYVAIEHLRLLRDAHESSLPPRSLFLMGLLVERYANQAAALRADFAPTYAAVRGKVWKTFKAALREHGPEPESG